MNQKEHIENFLKLIPQDCVISHKYLAQIFCTSAEYIQETIWNHANVIYKKSDKKRNIWIPKITNYYVSLTTKDTDAINYFQHLSRKIYLLHPGCILKIPTYYHITLADLSNITIDAKLIYNIFKETDWVPQFNFHCTLHKPYVDRKKNKVIFWVNIWTNPFLLTLHQCIKHIVPRRSDKQFIPHITLGKILWNIDYNVLFLENKLDIQCVFNEINIVANVDANKDIVLFSKKII